MTDLAEIATLILESDGCTDLYDVGDCLVFTYKGREYECRPS